MPLYIPSAYHLLANCWLLPLTNPPFTSLISHTLYTSHIMNGRMPNDNTVHRPACPHTAATRKAITKSGASWGKYLYFPGFSLTSIPSRPPISRWEMIRRLESEMPLLLQSPFPAYQAGGHQKVLSVGPTIIQYSSLELGEMAGGRNSL